MVGVDDLVYKLPCQINVVKKEILYCYFVLVHVVMDWAVYHPHFVVTPKVFCRPFYLSVLDSF